MKLRIGLLIIVSLVFLASCGTQQASPTAASPDEVTLQLKWIHQAQFAGYYVALEKGFYVDENIDLTILPGGVGIEGLDQISIDAADFAVVRPEGIIQKKDEGIDLLAVAVIYQRNPFVLISLADSGITRPQDFIGKTIAIKGITGEVQYEAMMRNVGIDPNDIIEVEFSFDYTSFYNGEVDIYPGFAAGSLLDILKTGVEVNQIWPDDYGVHWYSDTIAVTPEFADANPDLITRFLRATIKGHEYALANPEEAVEITLQYADVQDYDVQMGMLEASMPMIHTGENPIGWMDAKVFEGMITDMESQGLIST